MGTLAKNIPAIAAIHFGGKLIKGIARRRMKKMENNG